MKEIGLYIHIPFCRSKCLYCDFNSYEKREGDSPEYVRALLRELSAYQEKYGLKFKTAFIGGGTPTVINYGLIGALMEKLMPQLVEGAEVTMECNPGTVSGESLAYYRSMGINRLSIGLQAWQPELLRTLGRIHGREEFLEAYYGARKAGFHNISVDLMFALPGQTMEMWEETLMKVCSLEVDHISCYSLKLEEGTRLYELHNAGKVLLPDEDMDRDMYAKAIEILEMHGYSQYEISNFARKGMESRHNLIYWHNEEYLGIGAGSHSKLQGSRFWNCKDIARYIESLGNGELPVEDSEQPDINEDMWETIFLALRLNEGLRLSDFENRYKTDFMGKYGAAVKKLEVNGLVYLEDGRLKLTGRGRDLSNSVFIEFM